MENFSNLYELLNERSSIIIGRHASCDVIVSDGSVSRRHCKISVLDNGKYVLTDLESRNGTYVNGLRIKNQVISGDDLVKIGVKANFKINPTLIEDTTTAMPTRTINVAKVQAVIDDITPQVDIEETPKISPSAVPTNTIHEAPLSPSPSEIQVDICCLYDASDEALCLDIKRHLGVLKRHDNLNVNITGIFDFPAGADVAEHMQKAIAEAEIILLFISAEFIHDDTFYEESTRIIEKFNQGSVHIVPVISKFCLWDLTPFAKLPVLPSNKQPINSTKHWPNKEEALHEVAKGIYKLIKGYYKVKSASVHTGKTASTSEYITTAAKEALQTAEIETNSMEAALANAQKPTLSTHWRSNYLLQQLWRRGLASVLDNAWTMLLALIIGFVLVIFDTSEEAIISVTIANVLYYCLSTIGLALFEASEKQATPAKKYLGLQVSNHEGKRISFMTALIRIFTKSLFLIPICMNNILIAILFIIGYIAYYFYKRQFLHDVVTKTIISYHK